MCHNNSAFIAFTAARSPTRVQKRLGVNDFYYATADALALGQIQRCRHLIES